MRVSAKFRRHYGCKLVKHDPPVQSFPQTWNLDILSHGRSQLLVLASEEHTLFSVLVPTSRTRNLERFMAEFRARFFELLENIRIHSADRPDPSQVMFAGRIDRRIVGSQNDLLLTANCFLMEAEKPASTDTLRMIEERLNETPLSYLGMASPIEALRGSAAKLKVRDKID